jgi:hypothetical protein
MQAAAAKRNGQSPAVVYSLLCTIILLLLLAELNAVNG